MNIDLIKKNFDKWTQAGWKSNCYLEARQKPCKRLLIIPLSYRTEFKCFFKKDTVYREQPIQTKQIFVIGQISLFS